MKKLAFVIGCLFSSYVTADADQAMDLYLNQDYAAAFDLFSTSAELGHAKSQFNLGVQYLRGQGVKADPVLAYSYLTLALENGFKMARQAQKTVTRKLSPEQLKQAENHAAELITLYGSNGKKNIKNALTFNRSYNPTPARTENPEAKYPSDMFNDGIPGIARYVFDIDRNGKVRDMQLLQAYPSSEFAQSVATKLTSSRYQIIKINGSLRKFAQGQFSGVFKRTDMPEETLNKLTAKKKSLLSKARSGNAAAQAELADLLELMNDKPRSKYSLVAKEQVVATADLAQVTLSKNTIEGYKPISGLSQHHFNLKFLVWLDSNGKVTKQQAFQHHTELPSQLIENARSAMSAWHVQVHANNSEVTEFGPYMAEFYYNNEPRHNQLSNYLTRSQVTLKPIVNRSNMENSNYWRLKAAQAGHVESLMLLGANCNIPLLSIAASMQHTPAKTLAAKCILNLASSSKAQLAQAKSWLVSAAMDNDFVAMRELAGLYVKHSNNQGELQKAIELAQQAADEMDDPWAFEYMAAAYAKLGLFDDAIDAQKDAIKKGWNRDYYVELSEQRLAAYENSELAIW